MKWIIIVFLVLSSAAMHAQEHDLFSIGSIKAYPGEIVSGKLIVEEGIDKGSYIPITIIYGKKPGPVLALQAGIHGTEYVPVIVLQKIRKEINPEVLSGILILIQVANIPSFHGRDVYSNPIDFKNANRVYPGKTDGSFSERLVYTLSNQILGKSDYFIDLHGGEYNEHLLNYLYFYYGCPDESLCKSSRLMAHAMGNRYLIPYDYYEVSEDLPSKYSDVEAIRRGVPCIVAEFGDRGEVDPSVLEFAEKGIFNVMKTLGMLEGERFVTENPIYMLEEEFLESKCDGIFYPLFDKGHYVTKGSLLGYTTDYWGKVIQEFKAPCSGIIISIYHSPIANEGDNVVHMAKVSDKFME